VVLYSWQQKVNEVNKHENFTLQDYVKSRY